MIQIVPAIDIIGGRCVRLTRGDYALKKEYKASPVDAAKAFADCGVERIHVVDLDGAKASEPRNLSCLSEIASAVSCGVEWGGGISSSQALSSVFSAGATHAIIGSVAANDPELFGQWLSEHGDRMILGADVRDGLVSVRGWQEQTRIGVEGLVGRFPSLREVICTDIGRDGMLRGPATELYVSLRKAFPKLGITVSGGVASMDDVRALDGLGLDRVIIGKAFYEGRISLREIQEWSQKG